MTKTPILAANNWANNGYLIRDVARLRYLRRNWLTLDPTYGRGVWWSQWRPRTLFDHDLTIDGHDFRELPYDTGMFDAIAFDPPYVSMGGRQTTKIKEFYERYGLIGAPTSPAKLQALCNDGMTEMARLIKPGGIIITKCQDYVSSGKLWTGTLYTQQHALSLGLKVEAQFLHYGSPRMQPKRTRKDGTKSRQKHPRNNWSMLYVFKAAA